MQIFAYSTCPDFQALLEVEVKELTGTKPIIQDALDELKNLISMFQTIDVLIIDSENIADIIELEEHLHLCQNTINHIMILGEEVECRERFKFYSRTNIEILFKDLALIIGPHLPTEKVWASIPVCTLCHFQVLPFDLYLKLSEFRFIKMVPAFEAVDSGFIKSLRMKGVDEVYYEKKFKRDFSMMLINNLINRIDQGYKSNDELFHVREEVFSTTKKILQSLGISGRVVEVCESAAEKMISEVLQQPGELRSYLLCLKRDKDLSFHFKLIHLTNYIGAQLINRMNLPQLEQQVRKLVYASFFCDMCLKQKGAHFYRNANDSNEELTLDEQNEINFHALKASELIKGHLDNSNEIKIIILQHHGSFSGIGFPVVKSSELLPLSKILIVAQDLAFDILKNEDTPALEVLRSFIKKSDSSSLKELLDCLQETLLAVE